VAEAISASFRLLQRMFCIRCNCTLRFAMTGGSLFLAKEAQMIIRHCEATARTYTFIHLRGRSNLNN
jgi:hypothetical protein